MEMADSNQKYRPKSYIAFLFFISVIGAFSSWVNDMYLPVIPSMMREFHTSASLTQLGLSMAMLGMGAGSVVWGSFSDRRGRRPTLLLSLGVFVAATLVSLFSPSIHFFNACRLVQGFGAGGAMVLSTSLPADVYSGRRLAALMGAVGALSGIAPAAGPLLGGFMAGAWGWKGIFIALGLLGAGMWIWSSSIHETLPPSRRLKGGSLRLLWASYRRLLGNWRFMVYVVIKALGIAFLYAYISSGPFILQDHYGFSALRFGLIFGANAAAIALGAMAAPRMRVMKRAMVAGCAGLFLFSLGLAAVVWRGASFLCYELTAVPALFFAGMIFSSANTLSMEVGREEAGTASAILSVVKYLLAALVSPLCGLGNLLHSTAVVMTATVVILLVMGIFAWRLSPLADMVRK